MDKMIVGLRIRYHAYYMNIEKALKIQGWMSPSELEFLASMAEKCRIIVEIGCYQGRSTRAIADNTLGIVYAVDDWNSSCYNDKGHVMYVTDNITRNIFYANLGDKIRDGTVTVFPVKFEKFLMIPEFPSFIFIDANHRYEDVKKDIEKAMSFGPRYIGGHDYCEQWPGVIKAVNERFIQGINREGESIWWTQLR